MCRPTPPLQRVNVSCTNRTLVSLSLALALLLASRAGGDTPQSALQSPSSPPVVLITGSNRGIGLAVTAEFVGRGWKVIATCRDPEHAKELKEFAAAHPMVVVEKLDVGDDRAIDRLAARYRGQPIDVLFNNAGIGGRVREQQPGNLTSEEFEQFMRVNAYAPLRLSQAFLDNIAASRQRRASP
jgi:NAD(P)-dependent dehydrogenase (short-subunit alcohol dehydrogenase family)